MTAPGISSVLLVRFLGIWWLVTGIADLVSLIWDRTHWALRIIGGIIGIVAGIAIIEHPLLAPILFGTALVVFIGFTGVAYGVTALVRAFQGDGWGSGLLGVAYILIGLVLAFDPFAGAIALPLVVGVLAIAGGVASIALAWRMP